MSDVGRISEAWSDQSRVAALAARRTHGSLADRIAPDIDVDALHRLPDYGKLLTHDGIEIKWVPKVQSRYRTGETGNDDGYALTAHGQEAGFVRNAEDVPRRVHEIRGGKLTEAWSEEARKAALEARRRKHHGFFKKHLTEMKDGEARKVRGVTVEKSSNAYGDRFRIDTPGSQTTIRNLDNAVKHVMYQSARSRAKDSLGGPVDHSKGVKVKVAPVRSRYGRQYDGNFEANWRKEQKVREAATIDKALGAEGDGDPTAEAGKARTRAERNGPPVRPKDTRTPAERKAARRVTIRQIGGDDGYHYHVIRDGRSVASGMTRPEAEAHRDRHRREIIKGTQ